MRLLISFLASTALVAPLSAVSRAAELPYDEHANASEQVRQALQAAHTAHKDVLLVFGANWCPDCRVLDSLYVTKAGELANAHRMGESVIVDFFSRVVADAAPAGH